jgi:hypothetical protein
MANAPTRLLNIERPTGLPAASNALFGGDAIAEAFRDLRIPFIALTAGASYRGMHDSLVNHSANERHKCCCACTRSTRWRSPRAGPR